MLIDLQQQLQNYLLYDEKYIFPQLVPPKQGTMLERLAIYANGYFWRLIDALQKAYDLLLLYLGDECFVDLAEAYIEAFPSRYYAIADFTQHLPEFLAQHKPDQPYLAELALFIRALSQSAVVHNVECLTVDVLNKMPLQQWPGLCFRLHPSVQCIQLAWNSFEIWRSLVQKHPVPKPCKTQTYCIVWRKQLQSYANSLTPIEAIMLQAIERGECFSSLCESVLKSRLVHSSDVAGTVAAYIMRWLRDECFVEVYIP